MPGCVNSLVQAFKSVGGQPIVIDSAKGSRMWDVGGNEYIDYVCSWGVAIIGHADDEVLFVLSIPSHNCDIVKCIFPLLKTQITAYFASLIVLVMIFYSIFFIPIPSQ